MLDARMRMDDSRGKVGSGVSWFPAKIRPANFQMNPRARIRDPNRRQELRVGNWDLVLKPIWKLEEWNVRRAAECPALAWSEEDAIPAPFLLGGSGQVGPEVGKQLGLLRRVLE
jgi:hypothetical protein